MLTITYCLVLCAIVAGWKTWRRDINRITMGFRMQRVLIVAYWVLAFAVVGDMLVSLSVPSHDLTTVQFRILLSLAVGMMPQMALFAFVATPITMRGRYQNYSFTRAFLFMEGCVVIAIIMLAVGLLFILRDRQSLLNVFMQ